MEAARGTKFFQKYQELDKGYDMVIGDIANDRMFYVLDSFLKENDYRYSIGEKSICSRNLDVSMLLFTQKACDAVKIERKSN